MRESAPHNPAAEMAIIGAVLFDNSAFGRVQDVLASDDFHSVANAAIWDVIVSLIGQGRTADAVTLREHFAKSETLKQIGGDKYLAALIDSAAFGPEISDYAAIILDMANRRRLTAAAHQIIREVDAADGIDPKPLSDLTAIAQTAIDRANRVTQRRKFEAMPAAAIKSVTKAMQRKGGGISTGLKALDRRLGGLFNKDLTILAARPSMGKTALALQLAMKVGAQDVPEGEEGGIAAPEFFGADAPKRRVVGFFSLEMGADQISQRALSAAMYETQNVRLPYQHMRNGWVKPEKHQTAMEAAAMRMPFVQVDDTGNITLGYLKERCSALRKAYGRLDVVFVDYLQLMNVEHRNRGETEASALGRISKGLKDLAKEFDMPVVALSQLSRGVDGREDKRPMLSDLRDSGAIEQDADNVAFVYREHYYLERAGEPKKAVDKADYQNALDRSEPCLDVLVAKQRGGPIGDVHLFWDGATGFIADEREEVTRV